MLARAMSRTALLLLLSCTGCSLFNSVKLEPVATSFQKPSNVAAYVAVSDGDKPIGDLTPESFKVYENGVLLSPTDTQQVLLPKDVAAYHHTVLLVDLSGESARDEQLPRAAASFVETLRPVENVTVFAFDGGPNLRLVGEYYKTSEGGPVDFRMLPKLVGADKSRNLNGALIAGLKELEARLNAQPKRVKVGTLVTFARGGDLAGRVSEVEAGNAVADSPHDVIMINADPSAERTLLDTGKNGVIHVQGSDGLGVAFTEAANRARDLWSRYYLVSYCSPARGGTRRLKVEVTFRDIEGDDKHGSFTQDFDASGFGPGCRSDSPPHFVMTPKKTEARRNSVTPAPQPAAPGVTPPATLPPPEDDDSVAPPPNKPSYSH